MYKSTFTLPSLPPSMNDLYCPKFQGRQMIGMKLKDGALRWQQGVLQGGYIPRVLIEKGSTLRIDMIFHFDWSKRRFDTQNLCKLVIDTVAKKLGFNDKIVRHGSWESVDNKDREYVEVTLTEMEEVIDGSIIVSG